MSDRIINTIADVLLAHRGNHESNGVDLWTACRCGDSSLYYNPTHWAHHATDAVLAALKAAGIAVVDSRPTRTGQPQVFFCDRCGQPYATAGTHMICPECAAGR